MIAPEKEGARQHICVSGGFHRKWWAWLNLFSSEKVVDLIAQDVMIHRTGTMHYGLGFDFRLVEYHTPKALVKIQGKSLLMKTGAIEGLVLTEMKGGVDIVLGLIQESKQAFDINCIEALCKSLDPKHDSALGRACCELEAAHLNLYNSLSKALPEIMADKDSLLSQFFSKRILCLEDIKNHYRSAGSCVCPQELVSGVLQIIPRFISMIKKACSRGSVVRYFKDGSASLYSRRENEGGDDDKPSASRGAIPSAK